MFCASTLSGFREVEFRVFVPTWASGWSTFETCDICVANGKFGLSAILAPAQPMISGGSVASPENAGDEALLVWARLGHPTVLLR